MTNTTTQHIHALLVNDGHEFAMIRKTDLAALMQIAETDPHQGRFLDPIGAHKAEIKRLELACSGFRRIRFNQMRDALKHGEERRRYMANNKALQARIDQQDFSLVNIRAHWEEQRRVMLGYADTIIAMADREAALEARLLRVARFKRKFPAIAALMDMTP